MFVISPFMIQLILWIPFVVVLLISGAVFAYSGYKKGLWRALLSLGVTLVAALLSFGLSKLFAQILAAGVLAAVSEGFSATDPMVGILKTLLPSLLQALLAVFLFSGIFFLLTVGGKIAAIFVKKEDFPVENEQQQWAGLGIRAVDAIIFTILLLLPLYGSLGTFSPTLQAAFRMGGEETAVLAEYFGAISKHPLVGLSNGAVFGDVYHGLLHVSGTNEDGSAKVNISEISKTMNTAMAKYDALQNASTAEEKEKACLELISHLKDNFVDADWGYDLIRGTTSILKDEVINSMEGVTKEEIKAIETVVSMLDMSKEEFQENGGVMLDFMEYAIQNDVMDNMSADKISNLCNETFYKETASFLNATPQTTEIKKYLLSTTLTQVLGGDTEAAEQIMESYDDSAITTSDAQQQEIEAWMKVTAADSKEEAKEALLGMPTLDETLIRQAMEQLGTN